MKVYFYKMVRIYVIDTNMLKTSIEILICTPLISISNSAVIGTVNANLV